MPIVFVIEDDEDINELLTYNLKKEGFQVFSFLNSTDALSKLKDEKPDIIILDIMLPDIDGFELCKKLKSDSRYKDIPIIMLTARDTEIDKVVGLELGADDYVTKPFSFRELIARIKAILRRYSAGKISNQKEVSDIYLDKDSLSLFIKGKKVPLTVKEFKLLNTLLTNRGKVFSRDELLKAVWEEKQYDVFDRTVDVFIRKLREKLEDYGKCIKTVRGLGYKWDCESE